MSCAVVWTGRHIMTINNVTVFWLLGFRNPNEWLNLECNEIYVYFMKKRKKKKGKKEDSKNMNSNGENYKMLTTQWSTFDFVIVKSIAG